MVATTPPFDRPLTIDDLALMPDDGNRYELILGELIVSPSPNTRHQRILRKLIILLEGAATADRVGEVFIAPYDVQLSRHDVVQPDLLLIGNEQRDGITQSRFEGVPLLVIEITSPGSIRIDRIKKAALYERAGVAEYWVVEPEQQRIAIHQLTEGGPLTEVISTGTARSTVVPSFAVILTELFAES